MDPRVLKAQALRDSTMRTDWSVEVERAVLPRVGRELRLAFVGNSLIYYNNLPNTLAALAAYHGESVEATVCVRGAQIFKSYSMKGLARRIASEEITLPLNKRSPHAAISSS